jgi:hypothetical protein
MVQLLENDITGQGEQYQSLYTFNTQNITEQFSHASLSIT